MTLPENFFSAYKALFNAYGHRAVSENGENTYFLSAEDRDLFIKEFDRFGTDLFWCTRFSNFDGTAWEKDAKEVTETASILLNRAFGLKNESEAKKKSEEVAKFKTLEGKVYETLWKESGRKGNRFRIGAQKAYLCAMGNMDSESCEYGELHKHLEYSGVRPKKQTPKGKALKQMKKGKML